MIKLPETVLRDEAEMRAFYESCGISKSTTEAAIRARHNRPADEGQQAPPPLRVSVRGRKRKAAAGANPFAARSQAATAPR